MVLVKFMLTVLELLKIFLGNGHMKNIFKLLSHNIVTSRNLVRLWTFQSKGVRVRLDSVYYIEGEYGEIL